MLQCKEQFWQDECINGGFSKTTMPIGQLHYPSNPEFMEFQTMNEAFSCAILGNRKHSCLAPRLLSQPLLRQLKRVSLIHPNIYDYFEVGAIQAWYDDPSSQGAFCFPKPEEYIGSATTCITLIKHCISVEKLSPPVMGGYRELWCLGFEQLMSCTSAMNPFLNSESELCFVKNKRHFGLYCRIISINRL